MEITARDYLEEVPGIHCVASGQQVSCFTVESTLFVWRHDSNVIHQNLPFVPAAMCMRESKIAVVCSHAFLMYRFADVQGQHDDSEDDASAIVYVDGSIPPSGTELFPLIAFSTFSVDGSLVAVCCQHCVVLVSSVQGSAMVTIDCTKPFSAEPVFLANFGASSLFVLSRNSHLVMWSWRSQSDELVPSNPVINADAGIVCASATATAIFCDERSGVVYVGQSNGALKLFSMVRAASADAVSLVLIFQLSIAQSFQQCPTMALEEACIETQKTECVIFDIVSVSALSLIVLTPLGLVAVNRDSRAISVLDVFEEVCGCATASMEGTVMLTFPFSAKATMLRVSACGEFLKLPPGDRDGAQAEQDWIHASEAIPPSLATPLQLPLEAPDPKAKPVTFGKPIKSSGYTKVAPWSVQQAALKAKPKPKSGKTGVGSPVSSKRALAAVRYDSSCGPCTTLLGKANAIMRTPLHSGSISAMRWDSSGNFLITASSDTTAHMLKIPVSKNNGEGIPVRGHKSSLTALDVNLSLSNPLVATGSFDGNLAIWRPTRREQPYIMQPFESSKEVRGVKFMFMDSLIGVASASSIHLCRFALDDGGGDLARKRNLSQIAVRGSIRCDAHNVVAFDSLNAVSSSIVVFAASNKSIVVHDFAVGKDLNQFADAHSRAIHTIEMHTGSRYAEAPADTLHTFASVGLDKCARLWDIRAGEAVRVFSQHINSAVPVGAAFSPCGRFLVVGSEDRAFYTYDRSSGSLIERTPMPDTVSALRFNPTQPALAAATNGGAVRFFGV